MPSATRARPAALRAQPPHAAAVAGSGALAAVALMTWPPCRRGLRGRRACAPWPSASPWAMAAISDSMNRPSACDRSAMRGSACITAKLDSGALPAILCASASALARPWPVVDQVLRQADALAFVGVVDAAGEHHVGHARDADQARHARRAAAADEDAALAFGQAVVGAALGDADVARARRAPARRRPPRRAAPPPPARGRTAPRRTRHATCASAARLRATLRSDSSDRSSPAQKCSPSPLSTTRARRVGQVDEGRSMQLQDQRVVDGVALGRAVQAQVQHGTVALGCAAAARRQAGGRGVAVMALAWAASPCED